MTRRVDHVLRPSVPWRPPELTECGRQVAKVAAAISHDAVRQRVTEIGKRRAVLTLCINCIQRPHPTWDQDPLGLLAHARYSLRHDAIKRDLLAAALLIAAHREEFDETVAGLADAPRLGDQIRVERQ